MDSDLHRIWKRPWPVLRHPDSWIEGLKKPRKPLLRIPVSGPRFEHKTFRIRNKSTSHSTAGLGNDDQLLKMRSNSAQCEVSGP
jgi:hypothetical protein